MLRIARSAGELDVLSGLIHDSWFDLAKLLHSKADRSMVIEIAIESWDKRLYEDHRVLFRRIKVPYLKAFLTIYNVDDFEIRDTEKVGTYDINWIHYDSSNGTVKFETGIPLFMEVRVENLDVRLEVTEHVSHWKRKTVLL